MTLYSEVMLVMLDCTQRSLTCKQYIYCFMEESQMALCGFCFNFLKKNDIYFKYLALQYILHLIYNYFPYRLAVIITNQYFETLCVKILIGWVDHFICFIDFNTYYIMFKYFFLITVGVCHNMQCCERNGSSNCSGSNFWINSRKFRHFAVNF